MMIIIICTHIILNFSGDKYDYTQDGLQDGQTGFSPVKNNCTLFITVDRVMAPAIRNSNCLKNIGISKYILNFRPFKTTFNFW